MDKPLRGFTRGLAGAFIVMLLAGCGFYLKGSRPLPPELSRVFLYVPEQGVIKSRLEESLAARLRRRGVQLVQATEADGRLTVYRLDQELRILSVSAVTGRAIEYEVEVTVSFDYTFNGRIRVPRETLTVLREYSFDSSRVLATEEYSQELRHEMQEELADLILLRIDAVLATTPAPDPVDEPADSPDA